MRSAFVNTLVELAGQDARILLLTGDLGFMALEPFSDQFPDRFVNVGVAEQNMVGLATGLAEAGMLPFCYSIVTFASLRPYEFIRNGPVLHQLPVRIVGVGGGFEYGPAGPTHHGLEDIGVMRVQPGLTVVAPADHLQVREVILQTWKLPGPVYYRLGKDDKTVIPGLDGRFELGRAQTIREGNDVLLVTMGSSSSEVALAAQNLAERGINCQVMVVASLNPAPADDLRQALSRFKIALTVEAHYIWGGLGSLVCEVVAEAGLSCRVVRLGVRTVPTGPTGSQSYYLKLHGLDHLGIEKSVIESLALAEARP